MFVRYLRCTSIVRWFGDNFKATLSQFGEMKMWNTTEYFVLYLFWLID